MERQLTNFIRALRSADVPVSTGEAIDAARAVALTGYADRQLLKTSLGCILAKSEHEKMTHDELFEAFFTRPQTSTKEEFERNDQNTDDIGSIAAIEAIVRPEKSAELAAAIERAAETAGADSIRFSTQVAYYSQEILRSLGGDVLQAALLDALKRGGTQGEAEAQRLIEVRRQLMAAARQRAQQSFEVFGKSETDRFRDEIVATQRLSALEMRDMSRMKLLVARIAKRLAAKHSLRLRRTTRGALDIRRTIRANVAFDNIPFNIIWRRKKKDRPKIVAVCDVSGSVASYVRFLLMLLYAMRETVPEIRTFAFSFRLRCVDHYLDENDFESAMSSIIREIGLGSSSYGQAWSDFSESHLDTVDRRTTIIVLGDGRSNYGDPRLDLFQTFSARAKRIVWLNPEGPGLWGTGDSVIPRYAPHCAQMRHVANLRDLERAVDEVLLAYG